MVFKPYAEIDGQAVGHAPVVLHVAGKDIVAVLKQSWIRTCVPAAPAAKSQVEVRQTEARAAGDPDGAQSAIVAVVFPIGSYPDKLEPGFDGMAAMDVGKVVIKLSLGSMEDLGYLLLPQPRRSAADARDSNIRQPLGSGRIAIRNPDRLPTWPSEALGTRVWSKRTALNPMRASFNRLALRVWVQLITEFLRG